MFGFTIFNTTISFVLNIRAFWNNVLKLFSGLLMAQMIHIGFSLLLPRVYAPADFAPFGIFLATTLIFFEINNFKLDYALMLPEKEEERIGLLKKAVGYSSIFSAGLLGLYVLYIMMPISTHWYYLGWIPLSVLLNGFLQPVLTYCNRQQKYALINGSRIVQTLTTGVVSCIPLFCESNDVFLIEGFVFGQLAALLIVFPLLLRLIQLPSVMNKAIMERYAQFPKYGTISSLLNTLSRNAVFYITGYFFSQAQTGAFTFTHRLVSAPLGLITSATGQAYFREVSVVENKEEIKRLTHRIIILLGCCALIPVILAWVGGPSIFGFLFGEKWRLAGEVARYLALWYGVSLVVTPLTMLLDVKGYLKWEMYFNIGFFVVRVVFLILGGMFFNFQWTMLLYCITGAIFNLYLLYFILKIANDALGTKA